MSNKVSKIRLLLRNKKNGKLYKIASLYLELDKCGDPYIKVMLPFSSQKRLYKTSNNEGDVWLAGSKENNELQDREIEEFSYKLKTGDSHFKSNRFKGNSENERPDKIKGSSTPEKNGLIEIGRIGVTDLGEHTEFDDKKLGERDVVFDSLWDEKSRSISIFVVMSKLNVDITNADTINYIQNRVYRIRFPDIPEYDVILTDNLFLGKSSYNGIGFLRPDNPIRCHRP